MTISDRELLARAAAAAEGSYSPYSSFRVGAALLTPDGDVLTGANIENAAFGASVCAETNAITTAVAAGHRTVSVVAVICLDGDLCTPCGNCRQIMREFGVERVVMASQEAADGTRSVPLSDLLPESFGPEAL